MGIQTIMEDSGHIASPQKLLTLKLLESVDGKGGDGFWQKMKDEELKLIKASAQLMMSDAWLRNKTPGTSTLDKAMSIAKAVQNRVDEKNIQQRLDGVASAILEDENNQSWAMRTPDEFMSYSGGGMRCGGRKSGLIVPKRSLFASSQEDMDVDDDDPEQ
jgi:hypothetical protein